MSEINMKKVCDGCGDNIDGNCKVWGRNAVKQIAIRVGGECLRNRKTFEKSDDKKINPIKASKRGM